MIVKDMGEGGLWYVVVRTFPTSLMAKVAWEKAMKQVTPKQGYRGIGVLRVTPSPAVSGRDQHDAVIAVSLDERTAKRVERIVGGEEWAPPPHDLIEAAIYRRVRTILASDGRPGRYVIRRPENRGVQMDRFGNIYQRPPGRG